MNILWGCSILGVVKRTNWMSTDETYRVYYGIRFGPFLLVWTRKAPISSRIKS